MKLLVKVVVRAGSVTKSVKVDVLGAIIWVVVEIYGTVMYSVYVWTLANGLFVRWSLNNMGWGAFSPGWICVSTIVLAGRVDVEVKVVP